MTTFRHSLLVVILAFLGATVLSLPYAEARLGVVADSGKVLFSVIASVFLFRGLLGWTKNNKK